MIYFAAGTFVIGIALFKRELLFRTKSFRIILAISAVMFFIGSVLSVAKPEPSVGALLSPMVCLGLFELMRRLFHTLLKRDPADTFNNWQSGMAADRLFNIAYFSLAFMCCAVVPVAVERSAAALL